METLNEFIQYLDIEHHPDTWSEYASGYAKELMDRFTDQEWQQLKLAWKEKSFSWQTRLIDVLYAAGSTEKYTILESMVLNSPEPVQSAAIEALELNTPYYKAPLRITDYLRKLQGSNIRDDLNETINSILRHAG